MSSDLYYTLSSNECLSSSKKSNTNGSTTQVNEVQSSSDQLPSSPEYHKDTAVEKNEKKFRTNQKAVYHFVHGCLILCSISVLICFLSILLLHAMSSIWLNPVRNVKLKSEFVYITVALATSSASLNLYSLGVFGIQIYLAYTNMILYERKVLLFFQNDATIRFVAAFCVFFSIPVFMTSFACYLYMEFPHIAALIAISILIVSSCFVIISISLSYLRWNKSRDQLNQADSTKRLLFPENSFKELDSGIKNQTFNKDDEDSTIYPTTHGSRLKYDILNRFCETHAETFSTCRNHQVGTEPIKAKSIPIMSSEKTSTEKQIRNGNFSIRNLFDNKLNHTNKTQLPVPANRKLKHSLPVRTELQTDLKCTASTLV